MWTGLRRLLGWCSMVIIVYLVVVLIGLFPVNRDFKPAETGVRIYFRPRALHTDLILPVDTEIIDWRKHFRESDFPAIQPGFTHLAMGWGERHFYLETPTWSDLTAANTASALLWPTRAAMHVEATTVQSLPEDCQSVVLTREAYQRLTVYILDSFEPGDGGRWTHIPDSGYHGNDTFYEAVGSYHLFNTCNTWTGNALQTAGIPVGWYLTWPRTTMLYLPPTDD
jgi:uncharacterized protein (TIGR02117 family)